MYINPVTNISPPPPPVQKRLRVPQLTNIYPFNIFVFLLIFNHSYFLFSVAISIFRHKYWVKL